MSKCFKYVYLNPLPCNIKKYIDNLEKPCQLLVLLRKFSVSNHILFDSGSLEVMRYKFVNMFRRFKEEKMSKKNSTNPLMMYNKGLVEEISKDKEGIQMTKV